MNPEAAALQPLPPIPHLMVEHPQQPPSDWFQQVLQPA
jgi:hypothetical protein